MPAEIPCVVCGNAAAEVTFTAEQAALLVKAASDVMPLGLDRIVSRLMAKADIAPGSILGLTAPEFAQAFGVRCINCVDGLRTTFNPAKYERQRDPRGN